MPQLPPIGGEVPEGLRPALPPIGGEVTSAPTPPPDFQVANEKDTQGNAIVRGLTSAVQSSPANVFALRDLFWQAGTHPDEIIGNFLKSEGAEFKKAWDDLKAGRSFDAASSVLYGLTGFAPIIQRARQQDAAGDRAAAVGTIVGGLSNIALPAALEAGKIKIPGVLSKTANPAEAAAVRFGQEQGVPVDAATVTGNRAVRGVQHLADRSLAGSVVAERTGVQANEALKATGGALAERVYPEAVTAEQAGQATRGALSGLIRDLHSQANDAYGRLRAIEATTSEAVAKPIEVSPLMKARMVSTLGGKVPTQAELQEMRNIGEELDAVRYSPGKLVSDTASGSVDTQYVPRSANAPVYHDILQEAPGTSKMTSAQMRKSITAALDTGLFNNAARGALSTAQKRLAGSSRVSSPILMKPGEAAMTEEMALPVYLRPVQIAVKPLYDRLKRESELVPLQGGRAQSLVALDRLINAPEHAPLSVADAALSDLKALARSDNPDVRTVAQGQAAFAVRELDAAVRAAAAKAGPEAVSALEEGRGATAAKYATADVLDTLNEEPVRAYRQLTAPKDTAIGHLRDVQQYAPAAVPKIGRAVVDDMLAKATEAGGFDHAAKLYADWQRLGPQTKTLLFGDTTADLDKFFLLAKKMAENPNPSGTGHTVALAAQVGALTNPYTFLPSLVGQIGAAGLSALLHSPKGIRLLTQGATLSLGRAPAAAQALALARIVSAAREAAPAAPMMVPAMAQTSAPGQEGR